MTVSELIARTKWQVLAGTPDKKITSGYVCDLLSWVISNGRDGTAWVTVHAHLNVVAVASLHEFSCVILPDNIQVSKEVLNTASERDVCMISAPCSSYGVAKQMISLGIGEV